MKTITRDLIKKYKINKLGYDFMGYTFRRIEDLSFHHLVIPKKDCKKMGLGDGYLAWNAAILNQETSHDYLHVIENIDREAFMAITRYILYQNENGKLDKESLIRIREILLLFEAAHIEDKKSDGKKLVRQRYITERIPLNM